MIPRKGTLQNDFLSQLAVDVRKFSVNCGKFRKISAQFAPIYAIPNKKFNNSKKSLEILTKSFDIAEYRYYTSRVATEQTNLLLYMSDIVRSS